MNHILLKFSQFVRSTAIFIVMLIVVFVLFEGISSTILFVHDAFVFAEKPVAERLHAKHDPELGWVNIPNIYLEDLYGPGLYFKTDSQSFRNNQDFGERVPKGKVRVICSGDSFTLGYGVDNDHTWCQMLSSLGKRIEAVNMGQGGYGIDQSYLWYKRDGVKLDHQIHLFAFISDDFLRMHHKSFHGYAKPVLKVSDGTLVTENVPVPSRYFYVPWLTQNAKLLYKSRLFQLISRAHLKLFPREESSDASKDAQSEEVAAKIFEHLREINKQKTSSLVLLYLPTRGEYKPGKLESWREFVHAAAASRNILLFDLINEFRKLPPEEIEKMFIPEGSMVYPSAANHYTIRGNEFVASSVYAKLLSSGILRDKQTP